MAAPTRVFAIDARRPGIDGKNPQLKSAVPFGEKKTVCQIFAENAKLHPDHVQLTLPDDSKVTTKEWFDASRMLAKSLLHVGLKRFDGVSIMGFNSYEWFVADAAATLAGGVVSGIYTTNNAPACEYIVSHSNSSVVFVEGKANMNKILSFKDKIPYVKAVVVWAVDAADIPAGMDGYVYMFEDFAKLGESSVSDEIVQAAMDAQHPDECCLLVYTSGTTGMPKAVMISHDNVVWTCNAMRFVAEASKDDVIVSFLPLSHVAANMIDLKGPICLGFQVYFATPDALKGGLVNTLVKARPTMFLAVPRVWEKIMEKMMAVGRGAPAPLRMISSWAKGVGTEAMEAQDAGRPMPWGYTLAKFLVFDKIKAKLGLDRARLLASSSAPISAPTLAYFRSIMFRICDLYGASEASGPVALNRPTRFKMGTIGQAVEDTDLIILNPDEFGEGEICVRGRNIFMGYLKNEEATKEAIDEEGFFHSGDMGKIDEDGYLTITGRFKELIITSGGENIAPVPIEEALLESMGAVSRAIVIGDERKYLSVLLSLSVQESDPTLLLGIACDVDPEAKTIAEAKQSELWKEYITKGIKAANQKSISNAAKIQKYHILDEDLSEAKGLLTPTLKVKRSVVKKQYASVIDSMYED